MNSDVSPESLVQSFLSALKEVPDTHAQIVSHDATARDGGVDFIIDAQIGTESVRLIIETKRAAFPRDVREAAWQLRNYMAYTPDRGVQTVPMVIAESISPGARTLLREVKVGYYDAGGSIYLPARGAFLLIDKPPPKRHARTLNALFTGRRAQVLHAIWVHEHEWFGVHEIARRASVSAATTSETLIALERRDWVVSKGAGPAKERRLRNRHELLEAWTAHQLGTKPTPVRHYFVGASQIEKLIQRVEMASHDHNCRYAITGVAAAQAYAPYLSTISQVHCRLAAGIGSEAVLEAIEARPVREGWNLGIIESKSSADFIFRERVNGAWFADPLQTYLDLLQAGGRSKELAEHLRAERLNT